MIDSTLTADEVSVRAQEGYLYAFPMMMGYRFLFGRFLAESAPSYVTPINSWTHDAESLDWRFKDVITPNADTPYSMGALDLRAEPFVLTVPEVTDRYYVMQLEDILGFNEYFVGTRATGSGAGSYLIAGPNWQGAVPAGVTAVLRHETDLVFILGRTQLLGHDDVPALQAVQRGYELQPLSTFAGTPAPPPAPAVDWPLWDDEASRDERFIGYLNLLLSFCQPTHDDDAGLMARLTGIGVEAGATFDADALDPEVRGAIRAGVDGARAEMHKMIASLSGSSTGWGIADVFGDREFFGGNHLLRAVGAQLGWGGNDQIEAMYPRVDQDADGEPLDASKHDYTLTWAADPPTETFWSLTMYDTAYDGAAGYLVQNPVDRYLINSTTEGIVRGHDGSLTFHIQHEHPNDDAAAANWLPAPNDRFYLVLRIYVPDEAALDGTWAPPAVFKAR